MTGPGRKSLPLPNATLHADYEALVARADLQVFLNTRSIDFELVAAGDHFRCLIAGCRIDETGALFFKTPGGITLEAADIDAAA